MPMDEGYWEMMKSKHADMVNTGGREGGSITAALFLKQVGLLRHQKLSDLVMKIVLLLTTWSRCFLGTLPWAAPS